MFAPCVTWATDHKHDVLDEHKLSGRSRHMTSVFTQVNEFVLVAELAMFVG